MRMGLLLAMTALLTACQGEIPSKSALHDTTVSGESCKGLPNGSYAERIRFKHAEVERAENCEAPDNRSLEKAQCLDGMLQEWSQTEGFAEPACRVKKPKDSVAAMALHSNKDSWGNPLVGNYLCTVDEQGRLDCGTVYKNEWQAAPIPPIQGKVIRLKEVQTPDSSLAKVIWTGQDTAEVLNSQHILCALTDDSRVTCWTYGEGGKITPSVVFTSQRPKPTVVDFSVTGENACLAHAGDTAECFGKAGLIQAFHERNIREFQSGANQTTCGRDNQELICSNGKTSLNISGVDAFAVVEGPWPNVCYAQGQNLVCAEQNLPLTKAVKRLIYNSGNLVTVDADSSAFANFYYYYSSEQKKYVLIESNSGWYTRANQIGKSMAGDQHAELLDYKYIPGTGALNSCILRTDGFLRCQGLPKGLQHPNLVMPIASFPTTMSIGRQSCLMSLGGLVDCVSIQDSGSSGYAPDWRVRSYFTKFRSPRDLTSVDDWQTNHVLMCAIRQDQTLACISTSDGLEFFPKIPGRPSKFETPSSFSRSCKGGAVTSNDAGEFYCINAQNKVTLIGSSQENRRVGDCIWKADRSLVCTGVPDMPKDMRFKTVESYIETTCAINMNNELYCRSSRAPTKSLDAVQTDGRLMADGFSDDFLFGTPDHLTMGVWRDLSLRTYWIGSFEIIARHGPHTCGFRGTELGCN